VSKKHTTKRRKRKPKCIKVNGTVYRPEQAEESFSGSCNGCVFWERILDKEGKVQDPTCGDIIGDPPCGHDNVVYKR
jgi:hypothetical protein